MRSLEKMRMTSRGKSCPGLLSCPDPGLQGQGWPWCQSTAVQAAACAAMPGSPRRVTGQWGHHRAALVAASGLLPALQAAQWPAPGSCSMLDGASSIYSLRQIETIAILKPRAQTSRGPSSPARLLRELVMHIAGDRHQVAAGRPMIWGPNDPLGWARRPAIAIV